MDILPTVVRVAADEPETAAKMVQPTMLVCSSRPGNGPIHGASPRNISSLRRVRYKISPIQMNNGSAVSDQLEDEVQMVVIMVSPAGRTVNKSIPTSATPSNASPTHTPVPSRRNSVNRKIAVSARCSIFAPARVAVLTAVAMLMSRSQSRSAAHAATPACRATPAGGGR